MPWIIRADWDLSHCLLRQCNYRYRIACTAKQHKLEGVLSCLLTVTPPKTVEKNTPGDQFNVSCVSAKEETHNNQNVV